MRPTATVRAAPATPPKLDALDRSTVLSLQRVAGNAAVAAMLARRRTPPALQRAKPSLAELAAMHEAESRAEKAKVGAAKERVIADLYTNLEASNAGMVASTCRHFADERDWLQAAYEAKHRQSLRSHIIRRLDTSEDLVRSLAFLYSGDDTDPYAQMGLSVIPTGTADDLVLTLIEERTALSARRRLADDYRKAFRGVNKRGDSLLHHLSEEGLAEWRYQKIEALLDHDLTQAEHLHFVMTSSAGVQQGNAADLLERAWDQGLPFFRQFLADWDRWVKGKGWVAVGLKEACMDKLGGDQLARAEAVFKGWDQAHWTMGGGPDHLAHSSAASVALFSALERKDKAGIIRAAGRMRENREHEFKADPSLRERSYEARADDEIRIRKRLEESWGGLFGDNDAAVEAIINLRRKPTPVDKVYFAMRKHDDKGVAAAVTEGWLLGVEATMENEALHPPAGDPRPPFSILLKGVTSGSDEWPRIMAMLSLSTDHIGRGAARLDADLKGRKLTTQSSDLGNAYAFLQMMKNDRTTMEAVVVRLFGSIDDFDIYLHRHFEESALRADVLKLIAPPKTAGDLIKAAKQREAATHTGVMDSAAMAMVEFYDFVTAERTLDVLDASMRRLVRLVRLTNADSAEVKAVMEMEGVESLEQLANVAFEQFKARLEEVRNVKKSAVETAGMVVDFAGRSALVALLGPVGLPGLVAALGAYSTGMLVREGLAGADYDLASVANVSTLAGEVAMFGFDESKVEKVISAIITPDLVKRWGGAVAAAGRDAKIAKGIQDGAKQAMSKMVEKTVQDMIEGSDLPGLKDLATRALHAAAMGVIKGSSAHITASLKAQDELGQRFVVNLKSIILNGPPPKAAIGMALTKELTDMMNSPDWVNMSAGQIAARLAKAAGVSVASALPVAAALTPHQQRDATRAMATIRKDPTLIVGMATADDALMAAYKSAGGGKSMLEFLKPAMARRDVNVDYTDSTGAKKTLDLSKWVSDKAKVIDSVVEPTPWYAKVGSGRADEAPIDWRKPEPEKD